MLKKYQNYQAAIMKVLLEIRLIAFYLVKSFQKFIDTNGLDKLKGI